MSTNIFASNPAGQVAPVTAGTALLYGTCRALLVGTAGAANITDAQGHVLLSVPLQQGYNPIACASVDTGTVASNIWALY